MAKRLSEEQDTSISTGFAWEADASDIHSMIERADQEMYLDKERHHGTPERPPRGGSSHGALRSDEVWKLVHMPRSAAPPLNRPPMHAGS